MREQTKEKKKVCSAHFSPHVSKGKQKKNHSVSLPLSLSQGVDRFKKKKKENPTLSEALSHALEAKRKAQRGGRRLHPTSSPSLAQGTPPPSRLTNRQPICSLLAMADPKLAFYSSSKPPIAAPLSHASSPPRLSASGRPFSPRIRRSLLNQNPRSDLLLPFSANPIRAASSPHTPSGCHPHTVHLVPSHGRTSFLFPLSYKPYTRTD